MMSNFEKLGKLLDNKLKEDLDPIVNDTLKWVRDKITYLNDENVAWVGQERKRMTQEEFDDQHKVADIEVDLKVNGDPIPSDITYIGSEIPIEIPGPEEMPELITSETKYPEEFEKAFVAKPAERTWQDWFTELRKGNLSLMNQHREEGAYKMQSPDYEFPKDPVKSEVIPGAGFRTSYVSDKPEAKEHGNEVIYDVRLSDILEDIKSVKNHLIKNGNYETGANCRDIQNKLESIMGQNSGRWFDTAKTTVEERIEGSTIQTFQINVYLDDGRIFNYEVESPEKVREHASAIIATGYRHNDGRTFEHYPAHRILKVKSKNIPTNYPDTTSGT